MAVIPIPGLNSTVKTFYTSLIDAMMATQRRPIIRLGAQRGSLESLVDAYESVDGKLDAVASLVDDLQDTSISVFASKNVMVSDRTDSEATVLTASASRAAVQGTYEILVSSLARAHRAASDQQTSAIAALGLEGTFVIGGLAARSVEGESTVANTVSDFDVNSAPDAIRSGEYELGHGTFYVEIRDYQNKLQFRLVDSRGQAVSIADVTDDDEMTAAWQSLSGVGGTTFDTGRGLTITFAAVADHSLATENPVADTVDDFVTSAVREGQDELASDTYHVEVRDNGDGDWEFRIVDGLGNAVRVYDATASDGTFTDQWQDIDDVLDNFSDGVFETGRGLSIDFGEGPYTAGVRGSGAASVEYTARQTQLGRKGDGAASVTYNAQGASITVTSDDRLSDIAHAINQGTYAESAGVLATVVDRRLVLTAKATGAGHSIRISDTSGAVLGAGIGLIAGTDTFKNTGADQGYQAATDASFTVNGVTITRDSNSGLTDVITGLTLTLEADAEGKGATLSVAADIGSAINKIGAFLSAFNSLQNHIRSNTGVSVVGSGDSASYVRNPLSGDTMLSRLRSRLFSVFGQTASGVSVSAPENLRGLGITLDDNLAASISDRSALEAALESNFDGVLELFDAIMSDFEDALSPFTDTYDGIMDTRIRSTNDRMEQIDDRIDRLEAQLARRRVNLEKQYGYLQVQLAQMSYLQQQLGGFWGGWGE